tara:strand:+ start:139 stop:279 length:141 start_codon:yes stop_codon:yes gene_type:complete
VRENKYLKSIKDAAEESRLNKIKEKEATKETEPKEEQTVENKNKKT